MPSFIRRFPAWSDRIPEAVDALGLEAISDPDTDQGRFVIGIIEEQAKLYRDYGIEAFIAAAVDMLYLPLYFDYKVDVVSETECPTGLSDTTEDKTSDESRKDSGTDDQREESDNFVRYRLVKSLEIKSIKSGRGQTTRVYSPPNYQVPTRGFWRKLRPTSWGKDVDGKPILGKTWVTAHIRHKDKPPGPRRKTVLLKEITEEARETEKSLSSDDDSEQSDLLD